MGSYERLMCALLQDKREEDQQQQVLLVKKCLPRPLPSTLLLSFIYKTCPPSGSVALLLKHTEQADESRLDGSSTVESSEVGTPSDAPQH